MPVETCSNGDTEPAKQQKNTKNLIDGLTAQDFVDMFNTAAEKSGSTTRATVQERPKTTLVAAINLRQKHLNEPGKLDGK